MKKIKQKKYLILLIVIGIFLGIYGFSHAKYVFNSIWDYYLKSKGFYFSSDHLGSNIVKNVDTQWDGGSVHFNIKNSLNQAVITSYDINYQVACNVEGEAAAYAECQLNGTEFKTQDGILSRFQTCSNTTGDGFDVGLFNKTACELGGYNWIDQVAIKDLYFDVVLKDNNYELSDVTVNIIVTSTAPYRKNLSGNFKLHKRNTQEDNVTLDYKTYQNYDKLIISNSHLDNKCVKVTWDADKLTINADSSKFSSYEINSNGYIDEIKFNIDGKKTLSYIFYKKNFSMIYDISEFQIEETGGC